MGIRGEPERTWLPAMNVRRYSRGSQLDRQGPVGYSEASQRVFAPHGPHLFVSRKFAAGGGLRGCDGRAFFRRAPQAMHHQLFRQAAEQRGRCRPEHPAEDYARLQLLGREVLS